MLPGDRQGGRVWLGGGGDTLQTSEAAGIKSNRTHCRVRTSTISPDSLNTQGARSLLSPLATFPRREAAALLLSS